LRGDFHGFVFIPALDEPEASRALELLSARLLPSPPSPVSLARPPLGGLAFVATTGEVSDMLDSWWLHAVPEPRLPVLLLRHEPGLERWAREMDAEAVVGVATPAEQALYAGLPNVATVVGGETESLVAALMSSHAQCFTPLPEAAPVADPATPFQPRREPGSRARSLAAAAPQRAPVPVASAPTSAPAPAPAPRSPLDFKAMIERATSALSLSPHGAWVPEELTRLALSHPTGRIVGVSSRAGGVGKTAVAAALGIIYGEAVQHSGWCAAVVDQNIGNPDQWGRLTLTAQVPSVFEIMADIEAGRDWSVPAWNRTPALAIYPERRDVADAYAPAQIERFAARLRTLHVLSVIDLPNRIPAFTSGEAAVCAGWVAASDLLLLPTTDDPTRLQGVLDYLDAPLVRGDTGRFRRRMKVVVPYVRSSLRAVREDPGVLAMLREVRARVAAVVEIPRNERATLAIVRGQPITEVDAGLRGAYVELALTVARVLHDG
jgi:hypothetical protein